MVRFDSNVMVMIPGGWSIFLRFIVNAKSNLKLCIAALLLIGFQAHSSAAQSDLQSEGEVLLVIESLLETAADENDDEARSELIRRALNLYREHTWQQLVELLGVQIALPASNLPLQPVQENTAEIYSFALTGKLVHVVRLESTLQLYQVAVTNDRLTSAIRYFIQELQISGSFGGMERASAEIHGWVVQPYLDELRQADVEKIVFVTSETLAPLPLTSLFGNRRYLLDEFEVVRSFGMAGYTAQQPAQQTTLVSSVEAIIAAADESDPGTIELSVLREGILVSRSKQVISDNVSALRLMGNHLAAGASVNLVSLWPTNENVRSELVESFESELAEGASYSAALRAAQLEMKSSLRYAHPSIWGGFLLVEW
jgi:CHAT domain-containing protein